MRFEPGDRVGNYRIERVLGSTTTGALYGAAHVVLPRRAALKVTTLPVFAKQLLREACILEALQHTGVPQVFESGLLPDRRPWIALETIDGGTLAEHLEDGVLSVLDTAVIVRDIAAVLEHAHRRGVVHRGLRPDRIVLTPDRRFPICIADWTDARTHDASQTIPHVPPPSARPYLAPELERGDTVDNRADIYALGVIAYLALTGMHPYTSLLDGRTPTAEVCPSAPLELASLIDQMLALDRDDRPTTAAICADLDWLLSALAAEEAEDAEEAEREVIEMTEAMRIRRPRWTPYTISSERESVVAGEIGDGEDSSRVS